MVLKHFLFITMIARRFQRQETAFERSTVRFRVAPTLGALGDEAGTVKQNA